MDAGDNLAEAIDLHIFTWEIRGHVHSRKDIESIPITS